MDEIVARRKARPPVHEMDCDVNARSLRAYAAAHGTEKMKGRSAHRTVACGDAASG